MSEIIRGIVGWVKSLNLDEKLSPKKNAEIIWFYLFLPCVVIYLSLLSEYLNTKPITGRIESLDPSFTSLVDPSSKIEIIATNLTWAEGPLWMNDDNLPFLLFSDPVHNRVYKWEEGKGMFTIGKTIHVEKSGCKTNQTHCDFVYEPGSNGLIRRDDTSLDIIAALHGERAIGLLRDNGTRAMIASHYKGQRLNSPNDLVWSPEGHIYFTDPPYGLMDKNQVIHGKELDHNGVYMIKSEYVQLALEMGVPTVYVRLLESKLSRPNGLAFSPDFSKLYVANSDPRAPMIVAYEVKDDGSIHKGKIFYNATSLYEQECLKVTSKTCNGKVGLPDGIKVDINGNVFAAGPGGVMIISPEGKLLGRILLDNIVSNLAFGSDNRLYLTAQDIIARVRVKAKPVRIIRKGKV